MRGILFLSINFLSLQALLRSRLFQRPQLLQEEIPHSTIMTYHRMELIGKFPLIPSGN